MSEEPRPQEQKQNAAGAKAARKIWSKTNILIAVVVLVVVCGLAYGLGLFKKIARSASSPKKSPPIFHKIADENFFSSEDLLSHVGAGPSDPARLQPSPEQSLLKVVEKKPEVCSPPNVLPSSAESPKEEEAAPALPNIFAPPAPIVKEEAKGEESTEGSPPTAKKEMKAATDKKGPAKQGPASQAAFPSLESPKDEGPLAAKVEVKTKPKPAQSPTQETAPQQAALKKKPESEVKPKPDEYQYPGSLTLKIHGYTGAVMKWGLMVIYDDSAPMGRRIKSWNTSRAHVAESFISKLPTALPPGSKIAVRDFQCGKGESARTQKSCLSRMLYGWADSPFSGLKDKLGQDKPAGKNNPCAAAAYSLKKDFSGGGLTPRVLIITEGMTKCAYSEVLKALEEHKDKDRIAIDLIMMGTPKKKQDGYTALAKRTGGLALKIENPNDLEPTLAKYSKLLKAHIMEKMEIRGEKTVYSAAPEEETTLPPGTYEIILPLVAGLNSSSRSIPNVKIGSKEAKVMEIRLKKGKPVVKGSK